MARRAWMTGGLTLLGGLGVGAGVMYLFDPEKGQARRRVINDTASSALSGAGGAIGAAVGKLSARAGDLAQGAADLAHDLATRANDQVSQVTQQAIEQGRSYLAPAEEEDYSPTTKVLVALGCCAAGAALMFLLDPNQGRRRRHLITDQAYSAVRRTSSLVGKKARHAGNVARGMYYGARSAVAGLNDGVEADAEHATIT